jgi:hypothetical protein
MNKRLTRFLAPFAIALLALFPIAGVNAATFVGGVTISTQINYSSALDLQTINAPIARAVAIQFTSGTGSNQANMVWSDERSLSSGANEELDFAGVLTDAFGSTITFATVKGIIVESASTNTVDITLGNAAATQFLGPFGAAAHTAVVRPGGIFVSIAPQTGYTVTGGSVDKFKVLAGAANVTYRITVFGTV